MTNWPVEFRWVKRLDNVGLVERVLQVRYYDQNTGVYYVDRENRYHPWQDVPVVAIDSGVKAKS